MNLISSYSEIPPAYQGATSSNRRHGHISGTRIWTRFSLSNSQCASAIKHPYILAVNLITFSLQSITRPDTDQHTSQSARMADFSRHGGISPNWTAYMNENPQSKPPPNLGPKELQERTNAGRESNSQAILKTLKSIS